MVEQTTRWCKRSDPKSPGQLWPPPYQTEKPELRDHGQGDDSGINVRGMTLAADPHELFKSEATSLHFADLSLLYSVLGPVDSFYTFSFH